MGMDRAHGSVPCSGTANRSPYHGGRILEDHDQTEQTVGRAPDGLKIAVNYLARRWGRRFFVVRHRFLPGVCTAQPYTGACAMHFRPSTVSSIAKIPADSPADPRDA